MSDDTHERPGPADAVAKRPKTADGEVAPDPDKPVRPWSFSRVKEMFSEYGTIAIVVWFSIFGLTWAGFAAAISFGFEVEGAMAGAGTAGAAYLGTQAVKPFRIIGTVALTPIVGKAWERLRPRREALKAIEQTSDSDD